MFIGSIIDFVLASTRPQPLAAGVHASERKRIGITQAIPFCPSAIRRSPSQTPGPDTRPSTSSIRTKNNALANLKEKCSRNGGFRSALYQLKNGPECHALSTLFNLLSMCEHAACQHSANAVVGLSFGITKGIPSTRCRTGEDLACGISARSYLL